MQILAVVVVYNRPLQHCETIRSLTTQFACDPKLLESIGVLIWDNSPSRIENATLAFPFEYRWTPQNIGVSGAYNGAAEVADSLDCPWLLLLDHDTGLPENFLVSMLEYSQRLADLRRVAAVLPFVRMHDKEIFFSPMRARFLDRGALIPRSFDGVYDSGVLAINSGTLLRMSALREIGGYSEEFWLDLSDYYVFRQLHQAGWRVYVAGDLELKHNCAMMDYAREMSPERYRAFSYAEDAYFSIYKSKAENVAHVLRLLVRVWRQYSRYENKTFSRITLKFFFRRFLKSRVQRMKAWRMELKQRQMPAAPHARSAGMH